MVQYWVRVVLARINFYAMVEFLQQVCKGLPVGIKSIEEFELAFANTLRHKL
jgi:hypothetical protein